MHLRLTITATDGVTTHDLTVDAPTGCTVAEVLPLLGQATDCPAGALSIGNLVLAEDALVGHPPLVDGVCGRLHLSPTAAASAVRAEAPRVTGVVRAEVVAGPDAGRQLTLRPGTHHCGRSESSDLTINDDGVSREHCLLVVDSSGVRVSAVGTTNPTMLRHPDGESAQIGTDPVDLRAGDRIDAGHSVIALRTGRPRPALTKSLGDGTVAVHRVPREGATWTPPKLRLPTPPEPPTVGRFPWLAMLLPVPICAVMAYFWGPQMLAFAILGPVLTGGNAIGDRISARRQRRENAETHQLELAAHTARVEEAVRTERAWLEARHPDPAEILDHATIRSTRLWERGTSADALQLRIGRGTVEASVTVLSASGEPPTQPCMPHAPVLVDLAVAGSLGITGVPRAAAGVLRNVVGQIATLVPPRAATIWSLAEDASWGWLELPPHSRRAGVPMREIVAELEAIRAERAERGRRGIADDSPIGWHIMVVPQAASVRRVPGLAELIEHGPEAGILTVVLDDGTGLPAECRSVINLAEDSADSQLRRFDGTTQSVSVDGVGSWWIERLARALAPLREAHTLGAALPPAVDFTDLVATDPDAVLATWAQRLGPRAIVGVDADGAHVIDLVEDGPHALMGGTTGAGKSGLLCALIAGLAAGASPADVSFALVDYKGGSAFKDLVALPHVTGVVTDLDPELADRALRSLTAEIKRRERLLAAANCADIAAYQSSEAHTSEALPRLVIIIDELRMLTEELPDFVTGLVRLASVGRSLGLHLVLATQRPAGAITADISANVNLRIALRVRDRADSEAILECPDAASISESTPGRAIAATGDARVPFQTALLSSATDHESGLRVTRGNDVFAAPQEGQTSADPVSEFVTSIRAAADRAGIGTPSRPWLPALPAAVSLAQLPYVASESTQSGESRRGVPWGLLDQPDQQSMPMLRWDPSSNEHLALVGPSGSGRTSALLSLAVASAAALGPNLHVHAIDGAGALRDLAALPNAGSILAIDDVSGIRRLVAALSQECRDRQQHLIRTRHTDVTSWIASGDLDAPPLLMLLIDGWDALLSPSLGDLDAHSLGQDLIALLRDGAGAGLRCVATGGRALMSGHGSQHFGAKIALGRLDDTDRAMLGLRGPRAVAVDAGHGVDVGTGAAVLIAHCGDAPTRPELQRCIHGLAAETPSPAVRPLRITDVPTHVAWTDLASDGASSTAASTLLCAVSQDGESVGFDPARDGRQLVVAGPRRSGRTMALATLAHAAAAAGHPTLWVSSSRSGATYARADGLQVIDATDVERLIELRRNQPDLAVFVDDADLIVDARMEQALLEIGSEAERSGGLIVCSADSTTLALSYRGLCVELAKHRTGLLLAPASRTEGDLFGIRPERIARRPGHGFLIRHGEPAVVQVATPPELAPIDTAAA